MSLANYLRKDNKEIVYGDLTVSSIGSDELNDPIQLKGLGIVGDNKTYIKNIDNLEVNKIGSTDSIKVADLRNGNIDFTNVPLVDGIPLTTINLIKQLLTPLYNYVEAISKTYSVFDDNNSEITLEIPDILKQDI